MFVVGNLEGCLFMLVSNLGGIMCCKDDSIIFIYFLMNVLIKGLCDFERGMCDWIVDLIVFVSFI